ncbi:Protein TonB [Paraglaciecola mesophila]|uniref:Protein TonB n=1 Tax=Paraglaciecola mesophila TaxID=197222 RepID=A0A857JPR7_9ALTE|nr:TonB family protein [Paraglaciecola mesophila]QHJ13130.1 Protein TonB [Paraglaciecola mesophila]
MHTTIDLASRPALYFNGQAIVRTTGTILLAASVTFGLFVAMQKLIENNQSSTTPEPALPIITLFQNIDDSKVVEKPKPLPKPKPIPIPKEQVKPQEEAPDKSVLLSKYVPDITIASPSDPIGTQITLNEGEARPVVRIEPKYPAQAARDGIEGWVKLKFSIGTRGQVLNIDVLEAQPKRTFDREAKRALGKWKYKPQVVGGKPQQQDGITVVLDFKLSQ